MYRLNLSCLKINETASFCNLFMEETLYIVSIEVSVAATPAQLSAAPPYVQLFLQAYVCNVGPFLFTVLCIL